MDVVVESATQSSSPAPEQGAKAKDASKVEETKSVSGANASEETSDESDTSETEKSETPEGEEGEEQGSESDSKDQDPKKKSKSFKKRIDKLKARLSTEQAEKEHWRSMALKSQTKPAAEEVQKPAENVSKAAGDGRPNTDDFDTHADYIGAVAEWKFDQKQKQREASEQQAKFKSDFDLRLSEHRKAAAKFADAHPDFQELMEDVSDVVMSPAIQEAILDFGPELMYELAKDREEFERINALPFAAANRAIGKFEAKLSKETTKEMKKSGAPAPLSPVAGKSTPAAKSLDEMDYEEFKRARIEQLRKK